MPERAREGACILGHGPTEEVLSPVTDNRFGTPGVFAIHRCPVCGLLQTLPRPDQETLNRLYERYYNFGGGQEGAYAGRRERLFASGLYRFWLAVDGDISFHLRKGSGRLLDIGCNEGRGLERHRANGFEPSGLELNRIAAAEARDRGFDVATVPIEDFHPDAPFDVAVLSNVLEHSLDPRGMLAHVNRILTPGGELWLSLPNADSVFRTLFGTDWINWHVPYHITHFTGDALRRLLAEAGFEVVGFRNETPALWVASSIIAKLYARPGEPTLRLRKHGLVAAWMLVIRGILFPTLWAVNNAGRGDCLVVRARKTGTPEAGAPAPGAPTTGKGMA